MLPPADRALAIERASDMQRREVNVEVTVTSCSVNSITSHTAHDDDADAADAVRHC